MEPRLLIILFYTALCASCNNRVTETGTQEQSPDTTVYQDAARGHWLDSLEVLALRDSCGIRLQEQVRKLRQENLDTVYTLAKYPARTCEIAKPASLDLSSSRSARAFRTKISGGLRDSGINFAGCYSLVDVPMTGAGSNYWVVDRRTGKAFEFPYKAVYISFSKESNLVIINPKDQIIQAMRQMEDPYQACAYLNTGSPTLFTDLQPFYVLWRNGKWQELAPPGQKPPLNTFWKEYFGK